MRASEATRQYQATLEARRAAWDDAGMDERVEMDLALDRAHKAMDIAWLEETVR